MAAPANDRLRRIAAEALALAARVIGEDEAAEGRPPGDGREAANGADWPPFSPLEESIVAAVPATGWMTTEVIAQQIGESPGGDLKAILRNLAARGVLLSAQGKGFRLNAAAERIKDSRCP